MIFTEDRENVNGGVRMPDVPARQTIDENVEAVRTNVYGESSSHHWIRC